MYDVHTFATEVSRFNSRLSALGDDDRVLFELAVSVGRLLPLSGAGVSLVVDGHMRYATAHTASATALEKCQEQFQSGPCRDAYSTRDVTPIADVREYAVRWPSYAATARRVGITGVAAIPMRLRETQIGVLDMYTSQRHDWSLDELGVAQVLAELATANVLHSRARAEQQELTEQLQQALNSRVVIEQAKGMLANRHGINMPSAFELIRAYARSNHRTVREVATAVVEGRLHL